MASLKALLGDTFGRLIFRDLEITKTHDLSAHFRRVELQSPSLRGVPVRAGDKVQLLMPGEGMRTYTPYACDEREGTMQFLVYVHGEGPAAMWARQVKPGDHVRAFGPRTSVPFDQLQGPIVLFGDETSFAVATALTGLRRPASFVFEVTHASESNGVVQGLGLTDATVIERTRDEAHLQHVEAAVRAQLGADSVLVMTGKAQSIQRLRAALKSRWPSHAGQKVKAYWSVGKKGLD